jgi:hypothetical protein
MIFSPAKFTVRRIFTKSFKKSKNSVSSVTQTKTGLSAVRTFGPLGVKGDAIKEVHL